MLRRGNAVWCLGNTPLADVRNRTVWFAACPEVTYVFDAERMSVSYCVSVPPDCTFRLYEDA